MERYLLTTVAAIMATMTTHADPGFLTKQVPVNRGGKDDGNVTLRFYEDMPSIAYISAADFQALVLPGSTINVTKDGDTYSLQNPYATATVNTATEQFSSDNYMAFTNLMSLIQEEGMDNVYLDGAPYIRYKSQELTPVSVAVTFDFQKYGIDLRGDDEAVYFPFATIADLYSDLYYHIAGYNGEKVLVVTDNNYAEICTFEPERAKALLNQTTRQADLADFTYGEFCFVIDKFYGMPGRSPYENTIKENGLDKSLSDNLIDNGAVIKQLLKSTDMKDYIFGMNCMQMLLYDGGHTNLSVDLRTYMELEDELTTSKWINGIKAMSASYPELSQQLIGFYSILYNNQRNTAIEEAREQKGLDETSYYYKEGDTAYLLYPQFGPTNFLDWQAYYDGGCQGDIPEVDFDDNYGDLSVVLDAMNKANEDPEVKNFVVDLSLNPGGSLDIVMAMTALMNGQSHFYSENTLTGQRQLIEYDVDCNFDGVFDEKDKEVYKNYNLNYAVLTSKESFSCGNLFPSLMKDMGFPIIGETSGGGGCAVQNFISPEGLQYQISSYRGRLTDQHWTSIDAGVEPDYPIVVTTDGGETYDYSGFYDVAAISNMIKEATDIKNLHAPDYQPQKDLWYTLDGRRVAVPAAKGIYINRGRKVVVKKEDSSALVRKFVNEVQMKWGDEYM